MAGSTARPTTAAPPSPPPASVQERLHAAWLQHAAASGGPGSAAGLDGRGNSTSAGQRSSLFRGHMPDADPTCRRRAPGSAPTNLRSSSAGPGPRLQPRLAVQHRQAEPTAALWSRTLPAPAAACMVSPNRLAQAAPAAPPRPLAPAVQLDASDWELLDLLRQEAEAASAAALPAGLAHTAPARSPHTHRPLTQQLPGQGRHRQPTSPLARQLAALRRGGVQQQDAGTVEATGVDAQHRLISPFSGSSSAQPPASPQGGAGTLLAQAVCLLVPQELLAEAEVAAAAVTSAEQCVVAAALLEASACTAAVGPEGRRGSGAAAMQAAVEQQAWLGNSPEHTDEGPGLGVELAATAEALQRHCEEGRYDAARELLGQVGPARTAALLEARDSLGRSPLMLACAAGHGRLIKLLVRKGAYLDAQDAGGLTALHHAVLGGHRAVAQHLLKAGADATLRSRAGVSGAELIAAWAAQLQEQHEQQQQE